MVNFDPGPFALNVLQYLYQCGGTSPGLLLLAGRTLLWARRGLGCSPFLVPRGTVGPLPDSLKLNSRESTLQQQISGSCIYRFRLARGASQLVMSWSSIQLLSSLAGLNSYALKQFVACPRDRGLLLALSAPAPPPVQSRSESDLHYKSRPKFSTCVRAD